MNTFKLQTTKEKLLDLHKHVKENYQWIIEDSVYDLSEYRAEYVASMVFVYWYSGNRYCFEFVNSEEPYAATIFDLQRYDLELLSEYGHTVKSVYDGEKPTNIIMLTTSE